MRTWFACAFALLGWVAAATHAGAAEAVLKVSDMKGGLSSMLGAAGQLKDVPYKIEWVQVATGAFSLEAVSIGVVDLTTVGDAPFIFAYTSGSLQAKVIGSFRAKEVETIGLVVPKNSPIHTVADLKDKRVATIKGSSGHYLVLRLLEREHLPPDYVKWAFLVPSDAKAAFIGGSVDAWAVFDPYLGLAQHQDGARLIANGTGLFESYLLTIANLDAIRTKRELLSDFLRRIDKAREWANTDREAYAVAWSKDTGLPLDVARFLQRRSLPRFSPVDDATIAAVTKTYSVYRDIDLVRTAPDIALAFDRSFDKVVAP